MAQVVTGFFMSQERWQDFQMSVIIREKATGEKGQNDRRPHYSQKNHPRPGAQICRFSEKLHPDIVKFLKNHGIEKLYIHQTEAYEQAAEGKNLVITTPTASGKSLCFYLPVIDAILKEPLTRALFVYPTKALAADQSRALLPWIEFFRRERLDAGVYDGDTSPKERSRIRKQANIILTNPEMLNGAMMPNQQQIWV